MIYLIKTEYKNYSLFMSVPSSFKINGTKFGSYRKYNSTSL